MDRSGGMHIHQIIFEQRNTRFPGFLLNYTSLYSREVINRLLMQIILLWTSLLYVETADRPGLLVDIIKNLADININVESAEIDTEV